MKHLMKWLLFRIAPRWTTALLSARARSRSHKLLASWGCGRVNKKLIERFGCHVQEGPFKGLLLTTSTHAEQIGPYLLGLYESELDEAWDTVLRGTYSQIIDIGAKFGYYAVALAKRYPSARVVAFDTDGWARGAVREMAAANGTNNIEVEGFCDPGWVARNAQEAALVISDCEGFEAVIFGPETIPRLRSATLIIETHDCFVSGVSENLRVAFGETHLVREYGRVGNRRGTGLSLDFLSEPERRLATQEIRSSQIWLLCLPRTGTNRSLHLARSAGPGPLAC